VAAANKWLASSPTLARVKKTAADLKAAEDEVARLEANLSRPQGLIEADLRAGRDPSTSETSVETIPAKLTAMEARRPILENLAREVRAGAEHELREALGEWDRRLRR
jgi:hypothetical protein